MVVHRGRAETTAPEVHVMSQQLLEAPPPLSPRPTAARTERSGLAELALLKTRRARIDSLLHTATAIRAEDARRDMKEASR